MMRRCGKPLEQKSNGYTYGQSNISLSLRVCFACLIDCLVACLACLRVLRLACLGLTWLACLHSDEAWLARLLAWIAWLDGCIPTDSLTHSLTSLHSTPLHSTPLHITLKFQLQLNYFPLNPQLNVLFPNVKKTKQKFFYIKT